jgi:hypothetical protein
MEAPISEAYPLTETTIPEVEVTAACGPCDLVGSLTLADD